MNGRQTGLDQINGRLIAIININLSDGLTGRIRLKPERMTILSD